MDADPTVNVVVFEFRTAAGPAPVLGRGPTIADDCLRGIWRGMLQAGYSASDVLRIYSEWRPSAGDMAFIQATFPAAELTYSFDRPAHAEDWPVAFASARRAIEQAGNTQSPGEG